MKKTLNKNKQNKIKLLEQIRLRENRVSPIFFSDLTMTFKTWDCDL